MASVVIRALLALQLQAPGLYMSGPSEAPGALMERADAATESGEHAEAAALYARSYQALEPAAQADATGAFVVGVAAEAHLRAFEVAKDAAELDKAEALLVAFATAATAAHGAQAEGLEEANALLGRIREQRAAGAPEPEAEPEPPPVAPPEPDNTTEPVETTGVGPNADLPVDPNHAVPKTPAETDTAPRGRDRLGLGLVVGGSILVGGGVGMTVWGSRFKPHADSALEDAGFPDDHPDAVAYRDDLRVRGQVAMISGGVLMAAGVGGIVWGAVRLSRAKGETGARAWVAPTLRGVAVSGRF